MKKLIVVLGFLTFMVSCSVLPKIGSKQASLENTRWILAEDVGSSKSPTLNIEKDKVGGNASCNNYFAVYMLNPNTGSFSVSNVGATRMACDNMAVETHYFNMLEKANKYILNGNILELYKDNLLLLRFKRN